MSGSENDPTHARQQLPPSEPTAIEISIPEAVFEPGTTADRGQAAFRAEVPPPGGVSARQLIAMIPDCVKVLDQNGILLSMSENGQKLLEIDDIQPYLGTSWLLWWQDETRRMAEAALHRACQGEVASFEAYTPTVRGNKKWWHITLAPLQGGDVSTGQILCVSRDVTERHLSGLSLAASRVKFETAFDSSILGMVLSDTRGVVLQANEAFCRIVDRPLHDLLGRDSTLYTHPDDVAANLNHLDDLENGVVTGTTFQKRYLRPDGQTVWTQLNVARMPQPHDEKAAIIATIEDITDQVRAQKALQGREQHLRQIFESVRDYAIMTVDVSGVVTEWNAGAERVFGYNAAEIVGRNSSVLWTEEDTASGLPKREREQAERSGSAEGTRWQRRKDGTLFYATGRLGRMVDDRGALVGFTKVCQDVTEQRKASRELAEAKAKIAQSVERERERLADVFKRSPSFMAVTRGADHVFEMVNDEYARLVGHRPVIGKSVQESLPEIKDQGFYELMDHVYRSGELFRGTNMPLMLAGEHEDQPQPHMVDLVYLPMRNADGQIDGIFAHGVDQTARWQAQVELSRLAEQRRLALDAADMGWWHLDVRTGVANWDERVRQVLGTTESALDVETVINCMHPEDREPVRKALAAALDPANPQPYFVEYRVCGTDGKTRWVQSKGRAYFSEGPEREALSLVGTTLDVTEIKLAQSVLHESEARFRQLTDAMPQMVFMATADGGVDFFNQKWYDYTGLPPGSVDFQSWSQIHTDEGLSRALPIWMESVRTGKPYQNEYLLRRHDGALRWHLARALPIRNERGEIVRWFGTNTDIHDQRKLMQEYDGLLQSERNARSDAERANRIKDEFLATLSHELRTPLSAILGWCSLLNHDPDAEDLKLGLETIERNARAQSQIIGDLLDMSAIISGKIRLQAVQVDMGDLVRAAVETVRPSAEMKGVHLKLALADHHFTVRADPNRLQQVLWNLLTNAVKFTPLGGSVQVTLYRVQSQVEFKVSDTGEGISKEFLPDVFDRFRQADASITRKHGGLGLGLAIVKQLVELHGGHVSVSSAGQGKGATFSVSLPLSSVRLPALEEASPELHKDESPTLPSGISLQGVNVLIVDDEPDARDLIGRILSAHQASVRVASSVQSALQCFSEAIPDILISDIGMPYEDGYTLIRQIRRLPADLGGGVPAIALTAYARSEDRMKAVVAGFQMHIAKPAEAVELLTMVASLVRQRQ